MAVVKINSGDLPSAVGAEGNALIQIIGQWASIADGRFPDDCAALLQMVDETDRLRLWEKRIGGLTFKDRNEFLQKRVLIDFNLTEQALADIVARLRRGETVTMRAMRVAAAAQKAPTHDDNPGGRGKTSVNNTGLIRGSTNAAYLAARLKRDHPEIAERLAKGEFRSVRAAAIEAGIVPKPATMFERIVKALPKLTDQERAELRRLLDAPTS